MAQQHTPAAGSGIHSLPALFGHAIGPLARSDQSLDLAADPALDVEEITILAHRHGVAALAMQAHEPRHAGIAATVFVDQRHVAGRAIALDVNGGA